MLFERNIKSDKLERNIIIIKKLRKIIYSYYYYVEKIRIMVLYFYETVYNNH